MIRLTLFILIVWALGSYLLWRVQSRAKGSMIDIGLRDRAVSVFWLPLLIGCSLWALMTWIYDRGRCA